MVIFAWIFRLILGGCVFFTAVLNAQGWLVVGDWANGAISIIPGLGLLSRLPLVGGWFQLAVGAWVCSSASVCGRRCSGFR